MEFEKVLNGVVKYIDKEIIKGLNPWQEVLARVSMARVISNSASLKESLSKNAILKTFAISDENGNIDVDGLVADLKKIISEKGCLELNLPLFGNFKFVASDVDTIHSYIRGI